MPYSVCSVGGCCCRLSCVSSVCMCVFFVLQGVCAFSTSTPLGKCNRCALQCSSGSSGSSRAEGLKVRPPSACCGPACILSMKSAPDHQSLAPAAFLRKRAKNVVANYCINMTIEQADRTHATLKVEFYHSAAGIERQIHSTLQPCLLAVRLHQRYFL